MYDSTPDVDDIPSTNRRQYGRRVRLERRSALQDLLEDSIPDVPDEHIDHVRGMMANSPTVINPEPRSGTTGD